MSGPSGAAGAAASAAAKKGFLPDALRIPTKLKSYAERAEWLPAGAKRVITHPAGPLTIHFWAPTMKWGLVVAGIADLKRPAENISLPQTCALSATGLIWSRYATQITPVNYNLLSVNVFVALTVCPTPTLPSPPP